MAQIKAKPCTDHLGNVYPSRRDMGRHYGLDVGVIEGRLKSGWPLEKALLTPVTDRAKVVNIQRAVEILREGMKDVKRSRYG